MRALSAPQKDRAGRQQVRVSGSGNETALRACARWPPVEEDGGGDTTGCQVCSCAALILASETGHDGGGDQTEKVISDDHDDRTHE